MQPNAERLDLIYASMTITFAANENGNCIWNVSTVSFDFMIKALE